MKLRLVVVVSLVVAAVAGTGWAVPDVSSPTCVWGRRTDPNVINVAYPDEAAIYWGARFAFPPGADVIVRGAYPHARYFSFNAYNEQLQPVDGLADIAIAPDAGSMNPFPAGADRAAVDRRYTVHLKPGPAPVAREPNTLYLSVAGQGVNIVSILYRVYIPDDGRDATGDVGLPDIDIVLSDGTVAHMTASCTRDQEVQPLGEQAGDLPVAQAYRDNAVPGSPATAPAADPLAWEKFFNLQHQYAAVFTRGTPARPIVDDQLAQSGGGYLSNKDNDYAVAIGNRGFGPVLVLRGRAPVTPRTRAGEPVMQAAQLRYWSVCTNERNSTRYVDCMFDEQAVVASGGFYTIVISAPADRPANATEPCGVNWLAWGAGPEVMVILRHMLPDASFASALQNVQRPSRLVPVVGDYLPEGKHMTTTAFESRGCPAA